MKTTDDDYRIKHTLQQESSDQLHQWTDHEPDEGIQLSLFFSS